ncbi:MAG: DUF3015 domain-containing protein [Nitrospirae bacterium]|nr:DUF3015 domain-containing protein [Candidatus Manganitrophaceae bacterium]
MKKLIYAAVVFALIPVSHSFASDTGPGCGFGTMIFKGQKGIVPQVLASTTNASFGSQTFGISTGTLGCMQDGVVKNDQKLDAFASANMENLSQEMAQGRGEHLTSLASLLGVPAEHRSEFYTLTQEKYTAIFPTAQTTSGEMLVALNQEMSAHPALSDFVSSH